MSPFSKNSRSRLSEQFADIYQEAQDTYRSLLSDLRNEHIDLDEFTQQAEGLLDRLVKLKRIHMQLSHEREELARSAASGEAA